MWQEKLILHSNDKTATPLLMTELGFTSSKNTLTIGLEELTIMRPEFQSYSRNTLTLGLETLL